jgi:hypothetical protein
LSANPCIEVAAAEVSADASAEVWRLILVAA